MKVKFKQWNCQVQVTQYKGGMLALVLNDIDDGSRITVATRCRPDAIIEPDHCFLKSYSENEGMLEALVDGGIVEDTGVRVTSGHVELPLVRFLGEIPEQ